MAYTENQTGGTLSSAQSITGTNTTVKSTNVFDVTGAGVGNAPSMISGLLPSATAGVQNFGTNTTLGTDLGIGQGVAHPGVLFTVTTTGTGSGTISFGIEAAPDSGSYTEGTYTVLATSGGAVGTTLTAGTQIYMPLPPVPSNYGQSPRFYAGLYTITGTAAVSVTANFLMNPPDASSLFGTVKNFALKA